MRRVLAHCNNYGKLMFLIGFLVAVPLLVLPFYPNDYIYALPFLVASLGSILCGGAICLLGKQEISNLEWRLMQQRSSLTVLFAWLWGILIGAVPFVLGGQLDIVQSLFEAVSGWTTTGLSVMDVSKTPHIYLFHRSFMQLCGGLGFVMMMVMIVQDTQSMNLYYAEGHSDKLMPNLKKTAQIIFVMYNGFLVIGTIAYKIAGMTVFDALTHTMCALSTGGFSTRLNSIGDYNSVIINGITVVLMLIGTTNFAVLLLFTKGKWKEVLRVSEVRFMLLLLLVSVPLVAVSLIASLKITVGEGLNHAFFNISSALSTTGYSTMGFSNWPPFAMGIMIILMLVGGGLGSTAGGIKMSRVYLALRYTLQNIRKQFMPSRNIKVLYYTKAQGKTQMDSTLLSDTMGFIISYFGIFMIGTLLLTLTANCSLIDAMFEFASTLGTVGLSIGITSSTTGNATLIVEMVGMLFGRLEIFIVLIGVHSGMTLCVKSVKRKLGY